MSTKTEKMLDYLRNERGMRAMAADRRGRAVLVQMRATLIAQQVEHHKLLTVCDEALGLLDKALGDLEA